jgi:hypothetical protein
LSILDQTGAVPDWTKLELPPGRTLLGAQRIWREMRREVAEAKGTESGGTSQTGGTGTTKSGYDASPVKKTTRAKINGEAIPEKQKAVRKPRAKNGAAKPGRKRVYGNLDPADEDDEPLIKKNKVSEDSNEVPEDSDSITKRGEAAAKNSFNAGKKNPGTPARARRTKNAGEKAVGSKKHNATIIVEEEGQSGDETDGDTVVLFQEVRDYET